jgi:hypothetical protein
MASPAEPRSASHSDQGKTLRTATATIAAGKASSQASRAQAGASRHSSAGAIRPPATARNSAISARWRTPSKAPRAATATTAAKAVPAEAMS